MDQDVHEVFAIRYGHHARRSPENFIGGDPHDVLQPLDYFVWAIKGPSGTVIVSHLHYDHCGNYDLFLNARYHLQDREMAYATGRCMCHTALRATFEADDVVAMVRKVFAGRVAFHDGDDEIVPGVTVHRIGGHSMGLQSVRVKTARGYVMLAADAAHLYAHLEQGRIFPITYNVAEVLEGYETLKRLATTPSHIVPGHDPLVLQRYAAAKPGLEGWVARLDVAPSAA